MSLAQAWLDKKRKGRELMILKLTAEAAAGIHIILVTPGNRWPADQWYKPQNLAEERDAARLARWAEKYIGEKANKETYRVQGQEVENSQFQACEVSLKLDMVNFLRKQLDHYRKKPGLLQVQIADIQNALDGKAPVDADDCVDAADVPVQTPAKPEDVKPAEPQTTNPKP